MSKKQKKRGLAAMSPEKRREIASKGAAALHRLGKAGYFTSKTGSKAGKKSQATGTAHQFNPREASAAGKVSAKVRAAKAVAK